MKSKLLLFALLLMGVSVGAQIPISISISDDCSKNGTWGVENNHQWVDLGLSVKWATMNIGATNLEAYGNYYAWGETTAKREYTLNTYKYCSGSVFTMTKYCTNSSFGTVDNKTTLEPTDDVAHVNWGGNWRMPTNAEWTELRSQCNWTWTMQNGVSGYCITANNGNSIFLPAGGYYRNGTSLSDTGMYCYYWSSSVSSSSSFAALDNNGNLRDRSNGLSVRPICP